MLNSPSVHFYIFLLHFSLCSESSDALCIGLDKIVMDYDHSLLEQNRYYSSLDASSVLQKLLLL